MVNEVTALGIEVNIRKVKFESGSCIPKVKTLYKTMHWIY